MATLADVRDLAMALPGVEERTSYGTPAWFVSKKLFVRVREDGDSLAVKMDLNEREMMLEVRPEVFHLTSHYVGWPMVLAWISVIEREELALVLRGAWRMCASKKLLAAETIDD